jgi:anthranilate synthase component I
MRETLQRNSERGTGPQVIPSTSPSEEEFQELSGGYDLAMITAEAHCDLETPVSGFLKLDDGGPCFILESAEKGERWGRYSFLGFEPMATLELRDGSLSITGDGFTGEVPDDPVRGLFDLVEGRSVFMPQEAAPFGGGAVGYFGYDVLPHLEKVQLQEAHGGPPSMSFMLPRKVVAFDHLKSRMRLGVFTGVPERAGERRKRHAEARLELAAMIECLEGDVSSSRLQERKAGPSDDFSGVSCNMPAGSYERMVERAREYIHRGDAFQVVLSQRFDVPFGGDPFAIYRRLRSENPSPYMFYLRLPGVCLVGSSPEPMVTNRAGRAVIRPIAGTRRRGEDTTEDEMLAAELIADEKERAEHVMLVDLARNDLGRVCRPGTVEVSTFMQIERYSHVMHIVSEVSGELRPGKGNYDLLRATFPAGTVSGAPKVRACQIIDELEGEARGPYAGAIGYLSFTGDMDTCIAIRTVVVRGGTASVQAGAGVVADSIPEREHAESRDKARALVRAVRAAGGA